MPRSVPRFGERTTGRLRGLDTLRAFAIVSVMCFHFPPLLPAWARQAAYSGWIGVDLFFVLSGYLIAQQLFRPYLNGSKQKLSTFYTRRLFRILPAYLVVLALYIFVPPWREDPHMSPAWEFVTFTENLFVDYRLNHAFSHVWSLCVEEHFYLFLPILTLWLMRKPAAWKAAGAIAFFLLAGLCLRCYVLFHVLRPVGPYSDNFGTLYIEKIYYPTYTRLDGLLAGVSLATLRSFRPTWWAALRERGHALLATGMVFVAFASWLFAHRMVALGAREMFAVAIGFPLLALGLALVTASALTRNGLLSRFTIPGAQTVATLAFSLYLSHKGVVHVMAPLLSTARLGANLALLANVLCCFAFAALVYGFVERPVLALRDRHSGVVSAKQIALRSVSDPAI